MHPYLLDGVEATEAAGIKGVDDIMDKLVQCSGKFVFLDKLLPSLKRSGHRVLIFSQMTRVLDVLQDYLNYRLYKFERLDGKINALDRQAAVDRYNEPDSDIFAFLLSTRAGGLGITLTAADTVIIFDSDWNLQNDLQAQDRCHRIGQTKNVMVYRLLTKSTYEMEMFHRSCLKLTLDKVVMTTITKNVDEQKIDKNIDKTKKSTKQNSIPFDKKEVEDMLKNGAYNVFADQKTSDQRSREFCEEDLEHILKRSQIIKYKTDENPDGTTKVQPSNVFSKASFVPKNSENNAAIELNDEQFW
jgi:chromodomain-helicase-DNA-binding protein 7